ncbi:MAG: hypothetical protein WCA46_05270 [Actinocatenispora sp.]
MPRKPASYADVEAELCRHPQVREAAVRVVQVGRRSTLTAYIVSSRKNLDATVLRTFLAGPRLRPSRIPRAMVPVRSLPRTDSGEVDYAGLPLPVQPGPQRVGSGKAGAGSGVTPDTIAPAVMFVTGMAAFLAFLLTKLLWPISIDVSGVPSPWAGLFTVLYLAEWLSFGFGAAVLLFGRRFLRGRGSPPWLTTPAHLALVWLLVAWWPQDTAYRLAAKTDWPRQAALVYGFNVTLMIAAVLLFAYLAARNPSRDR